MAEEEKEVRGCGMCCKKIEGGMSEKEKRWVSRRKRLINKDNGKNIEMIS